MLLDDVHCTGTEDTLLECSHPSIGNHICGQFLQDEPSNVAIQCQGKIVTRTSGKIFIGFFLPDDCVDGEVRLQDGTDISNGRVEICQNGIWGSVSSNGWNLMDASVVCRQLGYSNEGICIYA